MTEPVAPAAALHRQVAAEDEARANFYALLARLYADAPDAALLRAIAAADELPVVPADGTGQNLAQSWRMLIAASSAMDAEAAAAEYQDLFIGVGKSEVSLHASGYVSRAGGSALADLRAVLAQLGLSKQESSSLYEDHLAAICETMRVLIGGAPGVEPCLFEQQREFFAGYVSPWVASCCDAIKVSPIANYYRRVAEFTQYFMAIERDSFAID